MEEHTTLCLTCKRCKIFQVNTITKNKTMTCPYFNKINGYLPTHEHTFVSEEVIQCGGYKESKK